MKKELLFSLSGILLTIVFMVALSADYNQNSAAALLRFPPGNLNKANEVIQDSGNLLTIEVVKTHNTQNNCWIIVSNNVYDVTNYLSIHPGGANRIIPFCGKDATVAYNTKDGQGTHTQKADGDLFANKVGTVGEAVSSLSPTIFPTITKTAPAPKNTPLTQNNVLLTIDVIKKHNSTNDCWLIINNNVYNVTGYLASHPGGVKIIIPYCGADATSAFNTKAGKGSHSSLAKSDLAALLIGPVDSSINNSVLQQAVNNAAQIATSSSNNRREEEDDD